MSGVPQPDPTVIVVFGANGDLARRKLLPALFHLYVEGLLPSDWRLIGSSRSELSDEEFHAFTHASIDEFCRTPSEDAFDDFASRLSYVGCEFGAGNTEGVADAVARAEDALGNAPRRLWYLAVPPAAFGPITEGLGKAGLTERSIVVYEKPFGRDLASFQELDALVHDVLDEEQIYRIDHFLGKETLQNVLALRFANGMFEPVWNRSHIDHVQVDVPETLDVGTRGGFYEATGAMRDMIVTHLLQVLAVIAMEPPTTLAGKPLLDEKAKVLESMLPLRPQDVVYGQFEGYTDTPDVARNSRTETFAAARVRVDNWRWAGVPFFLRTGKRMAESRQTVTLAFKEPPRKLFANIDVDGLPNDHLTLDLAGDEGVTISFLAKRPGPVMELGQARMAFSYGGSFGSELIGPYERLLHDALICDRTLFTRADGVERTWELVAPLLADHPPVHPYEQESWGPPAAQELIAPRRWHLPET